MHLLRFLASVTIVVAFLTLVVLFPRATAFGLVGLSFTFIIGVILMCLWDATK